LPLQVDRTEHPVDPVRDLAVALVQVGLHDERVAVVPVSIDQLYRP
jgi:hypothetical protein